MYSSTTISVLSSIVRLGRRIYDNLRKAMGFIFAVHVPIAGLALLPLLFGLPILFGPVHIAFLETVIDRDEPLFSAPLIAWGLLQGAFAFAPTPASPWSEHR